MRWRRPLLALLLVLVAGGAHAQLPVIEHYDVDTTCEQFGGPVCVAMEQRAYNRLRYWWPYLTGTDRHACERMLHSIRGPSPRYTYLEACARSRVQFQRQFQRGTFQP